MLCSTSGGKALIKKYNQLRGLSHNRGLIAAGTYYQATELVLRSSKYEIRRKWTACLRLRLRVRTRTLTIPAQTALQLRHWQLRPPSLWSEMATCVSSRRPTWRRRWNIPAPDPLCPVMTCRWVIVSSLRRRSMSI